MSFLFFYPVYSHIQGKRIVRTQFLFPIFIQCPKSVSFKASWKSCVNMTTGSNLTSPVWADSEYQPCVKAQGGRRYGLVKYSFRRMYST